MPLKPTLQQGRGLSVSRWSSWSQRHQGPLSVNMISLPLGDFRHLSHIGSQNHQDNFGDLSFLRSGHNLLLQSSKSEQNLLLACAPPPKPPRLNLESPETPGSLPSDWNDRGQSYQRHKKCSSLPLLDSEEGEEPASDAAEVGDNTGQDSPRQHSIRRDSTGHGSFSSGGDEDSVPAKTEEVLPEVDDSIFSLDLGPSILDDVLRVMDRFH